MNIELTAEFLRGLLSYNPETGEFRWLVSRGKAKAGKVAGNLNNRGYIAIKIYKKLYTAHRLAWLYVYGKWPDDCLDHINRVRTDNRISNLRSVTYSQNIQNRGLSKANKSGLLGVSYSRQYKKWKAQIGSNGKKYVLGSFDDKHSAYAAYLDAVEKLHTHSPLNKANAKE